jgi:alpha-tubulin suppressor-like RCC1 family protein/predicted peptidase
MKLADKNALFKTEGAAVKIYSFNTAEEDGEKCSAIIVEYCGELEPGTIDKSCFSVSGGIIADVFVNSEADLIKYKTTPNGCYIIVELQTVKGDVNRSTLVKENEVRHRVVPPLRIRQIKNIYGTQGKIYPPWDKEEPAGRLINKAFDQFIPGIFCDNKTGFSLHYQMFTPENPNTGKQYPLVLFFHGGGEKGDDDFQPLLASQGGIIWATKPEQERHPCFVLVPQCPKDADWIDPDTYETGPCFDAVTELLFDVLMKNNIDKTKIYCTGLSMGSMAAWEINKKYPFLFAASIMAAGQGNYEGIGVIKHCNIWAFHSEEDDKAASGILDIMDTFANEGNKINEGLWNGSERGQYAEECAQKQIEQGGNILHPQYKEGTIQETWVHLGGWHPVYSNKIIRDWFFSKANRSYSSNRSIVKNSAYTEPIKICLGFSGNEIKMIACGSRHTAVVLSNGSVYTWGFNRSGQLGNGKAGPHTEQEKPVFVEGVKKITAAAAGNNFTLVLTEDGLVYGWGSNCYGQLNDPDFSISFPTPVKLKDLAGITAIAAGGNYALALKNDGAVLAWGSNCSGQLGNNTYHKSSVPVKVLHPGGITPLNNIVQIEAGIRTAAAIREDGSVFCWGDGEYGQIGNGRARHGPGTKLAEQVLCPGANEGFLTGVQSLALGRCFTAALKNGDLYNWGLNKHGELGRGNRKMVLMPSAVTTIGGIKKITTGMHHTLALKTDGTVWSWGYNKLMGKGVLGTGETGSSAMPLRIDSLKNIREIYSGLNHNFAIQEDGYIFAWGNNNNKRLGAVDL